MENHAEGELGSEEGEEPLRGVHVRLKVQVLEVGPQVWKLFLEEREDEEEAKKEEEEEVKWRKNRNTNL